MVSSSVCFAFPKYFFYLEACVNFFSGIVMIIFPAMVLPGLLGIDGDNIPDSTLEMTRWFGVMVFGFGSILLGRTLLKGPAAWETLTKLLFQCFLVSDFAFCFAAISWSHRKNVWTTDACFNITFSSVLLLFRVVGLSFPEKCGFKNSIKEN